jgi:hypothetical protein
MVDPAVPGTNHREIAVGRSNETERPGALPSHQVATRFDIDWPAIEMDYVAGKLSLREMARKHGCSHSAIANHAGRCGWPRADAASGRVVSLLKTCSCASDHQCKELG